MWLHISHSKLLVPEHWKQEKIFGRLHQSYCILFFPEGAEWFWFDGSVVNYTNWAAEEPMDSTLLNCADMHILTGQWAAEACGQQNGYVCMRYKILPTNWWMHRSICWAHCVIVWGFERAIRNFTVVFTVWVRTAVISVYIDNRTLWVSMDMCCARSIPRSCLSLSVRSYVYNGLL